MDSSRVVRSVVLVAATLGMLATSPPGRAEQPASPARATQPARAAQPTARSSGPVPVRNDVPKPGRELLVLRHNELQHGAHEAFYRFSRDLYWPYFERLGARVVGQWKVTEPASSATDAHDHVYRLVRYASFEHWQKTRGIQAATLAGNGPAADNGTRGVQDCGTVELGSRGAYFLEGEMAPDGPHPDMPGLAEVVRAGEVGGAAAPLRSRHPGASRYGATRRRDCRVALPAHPQGDVRAVRGVHAHAGLAMGRGSWAHARLDSGWSCTRRRLTGAPFRACAS